MCRLKHHNRNLVTRFWLLNFGYSDASNFFSPCWRKILFILFTIQVVHICMPWLELHKRMRLPTLQRTTPSKPRVAELSITLLTWILFFSPFFLSIISIFIMTCTLGVPTTYINKTQKIEECWNMCNLRCFQSFQNWSMFYVYTGSTI